MSEGRRLLARWILSALCESGLPTAPSRWRRPLVRIERPLTRAEAAALLGPFARFRLFPLPERRVGRG